MRRFSWVALLVSVIAILLLLAVGLRVVAVLRGGPEVRAMLGLHKILAAILMSGALAAMIGAASTWFISYPGAYSRRRLAVAAAAVFSLVPVAFTLSGLGLALEPQPLEARPEALLLAGPEVHPPEIIQISRPIYFENGSKNISRDQLRTLLPILRAYATCRGVSAEISAYASSPDYTNDVTHSRNLSLANARAQSARNVISLYFPSVKAVVWQTYDEMAHGRGIKDVGENGGRFSVRELLNRRADIKVQSTSDCS